MSRFANRIIPLLALAVCVGCASRRAAVSGTDGATGIVAQAAADTAATAAKPAVEPAAWHTVQADITLTGGTGTRDGGRTMSADGRTTAVRDSLVVISIMPMPGLEFLRIEARPDSIFVIDRINNRGVALDYPGLEAATGAPIGYRALETLASGGMLRDGDREVRMDAMGIPVTLRYKTITTDRPVRIRQLDPTKWTLCTLTELLSSSY